MTKAYILNLGCGDNILKEEMEVRFCNLDREPREGVDVAHDLETTPLPFEDETFDGILATHVLEHINNFLPLMKELIRILKPKGYLYIKTPKAGCRAAVADPTHVRQFVPESWFHFDKNQKDLGFDTGGLRNAGLVLKWNNEIVHHRPGLDGDRPGSYFVELEAEFEKDGPPYEWETALSGNQPAGQEAP